MQGMRPAQCSVDQALHPFASESSFLGVDVVDNREVFYIGACLQ